MITAWGSVTKPRPFALAVASSRTTDVLPLDAACSSWPATELIKKNNQGTRGASFLSLGAILGLGRLLP
jgi:hypothetical protein